MREREGGEERGYSRALICMSRLLHSFDAAVTLGLCVMFE